MESFHALLQKIVLNRRRWRTRDELRYEAITWIEHTYNRRRRQGPLGKLTPVKYEHALSARPAELAACETHNHSQPNLQQTLLSDPYRQTQGAQTLCWWCSHR